MKYRVYREEDEDDKDVEPVPKVQKIVFEEGASPLNPRNEISKFSNFCIIQ